MRSEQPEPTPEVSVIHPRSAFMSPLIRRLSLLALIVVVGCDSNPTGPGANSSAAAPGATAPPPAPPTKAKVGRSKVTVEGPKPATPD